MRVARARRVSKAELKHNDVVVFGGGGKVKVGERLAQPDSEFAFRFEDDAGSDTGASERPGACINARTAQPRGSH
jgi:hypothetical protein